MKSTMMKPSDPNGKGQCLKMVENALKDAEKHQEAKTNAIAILTAVKGLSSFVASMLSECPPAALAWAGICACIPFAAAPIEQDKKMASGLLYICERAPAYFDLPGKILTQGNSHGTLRNSIQSLYGGVLKYIMPSLCLAHSKRLRRFWEALTDQAQWEDILKGIKDAETSLNMDILVHLSSERLHRLREINESLEKANDREEARAKRNLLHWLESMNNQARLVSTRKPIEGTCQWFCQHDKFRHWLANSQGLLLVSAGAGCGKSVLSRYLIEEVLYEENHTATVCYFFFKDSDAQAQTFMDASKTILHCLLELNPDLVDECLEYLPDDLNKVTEFQTVWRVFAHISRRLGDKQIICVLDAFDESASKHRKDFLSCLEQYVLGKYGPPQAKFIVTTRVYPEIISLFDSLSSNMIHLEGENDEEKDQIQKEINLVMNARLQLLVIEMPKLGQRTLEVIREGMTRRGQEQRTYLWMHLMFEFIRKGANFPTLEKWRELFRKTPKDINQVYERLLQRVALESKEAVRTLLALILAAERPLTITELSTAVSARTSRLESQDFKLDDVLVETEFKDWILKQCGSFITFHDRKAYLFHQTAKEFLLGDGEGSPGAWQGSMTQHGIH
ncbi:ankyrin repeat protein [Colletotrichum chrysophilum]|uniref:Ankyrin repeat protein n=1 Tax=Colletotrichum chrysophilum TaxID=1836956 RepID=A0AAD9AAE6_9PEZI|nr:ankyrin repeat protein [Colletotrichum chrysophilum]